MIANKCFSIKQSVSKDNVCFLETLHNTQEILLVWHKRVFCHLLAMSWLRLLHFQITCNFKSKLWLMFTLFASITHSHEPLRKHCLSSAGSKGHVSRLWLVDFNPCCLFHFLVIMIDNQLPRKVLLFSCNPIGRLYLGGPGYRSRTVIPLDVFNVLIWKLNNWLKVLQCYKLAQFYVIWKHNPGIIINWCKWLWIILSLLFTGHTNNQLCQGCRRLHDVSYSCQHVK